ncbi:hypothetical protein AVEN_9142-1, partial [Araneus ventricosus]
PLKTDAPLPQVVGPIVLVHRETKPCVVLRAETQSPRITVANNWRKGIMSERNDGVDGGAKITRREKSETLGKGRSYKERKLWGNSNFRLEAPEMTSARPTKPYVTTRNLPF